ncbi:hypothetical protein [Paraburkholderia heleia]|uniref:hypothetical protein n=1 Tax=Paraburkholderia heleia TaxID=634127 RepID=UPI002AB6F5BC|nr:hypothetical protein [Paraburkholderia heleia]
MANLHVNIQPDADPDYVLLRTSANPGPERKPPMRIHRNAVDSVLALLLGASNIESRSCFQSWRDA